MKPRGAHTAVSRHTGTISQYRRQPTNGRATGHPGISRCSDRSLMTCWAREEIRPDEAEIALLCPALSPRWCPRSRRYQHLRNVITTTTALPSLHKLRLSNHLIPNPTTHHSRDHPPTCASRRHRRRDSVCRVAESRDTPSTLCRWGSTTFQALTRGFGKKQSQRFTTTATISTDM